MGMFQNDRFAKNDALHQKMNFRSILQGVGQHRVYRHQVCTHSKSDFFLQESQYKKNGSCEPLGYVRYEYLFTSD